MNSMNKNKWNKKEKKKKNGESNSVTEKEPQRLHIKLYFMNDKSQI